MPRRPTADYPLLERLYVTEDKPYTELAKMAGISPQSVSEYGKKNDWPGKRAAYKSAVARRQYEVVADSVANRQATIIDEAVTVARATLRAYAQGIVEGKIPVTAKDAAEMIRLLVRELSPDDSKNPRDATVVIDQLGDADFYRRLVDTARNRVPAAGDVGQAPPGGIEGTRKN